jgi:hypothetical protein
MKAILLNSARKLPYWHKGRLEKDDDHQAPLDYIQGAGLLNAVGAYKHLTAGPNKPGDVPTIGWDLNSLQKSENPQNIYKITLAEPADKVITTTAVWNKHYNSEYPFEPNPEEDANLRLELWAVDPNNHNNDYLLDYSDSSVDNVEHIYAQGDANYTNYELIVSFSDIDDPNRIPPAERYGLAWNVSPVRSKTATSNGVSDAPDGDNILWYDLNADGVVNKLDFTILFDNLVASIKSPKDYLLGDINANGVFDVKDLQILLNHMNHKANWYTENTTE